MHVEIPEVRVLGSFYSKLRALFDEHDMDHSGTIEYEEFLKMIKELLTYEELRPIYIKYASYSRGTLSFPRIGMK